MKFLFLFFVLISSNISLAETNMTMQRAVGVLNEFNNVSNYMYCDPNDPNAPAWCKDLYGYVCSVKKKSNILPSLNTEMMQTIWGTLPKQITTKQFNDAAFKAISQSESNVYKITKVERDEIRMLFLEAKASMKTFITSTPLLPRDKVRAMSASVDEVKLKYGTEYVEGLVVYAKSQGLKDSDDALRKQAYEVYMSMCGRNGLGVNAFYEGGSMVVCPGLLISLSGYNANKEEMKNALSFTFGHELGHAIDAHQFPEAYTKMQGCYDGLSHNPGAWNDETSGEISGDYWGSLVLSERLQNLTPADAAKTIAYAVDGFCTDASGAPSPHPEGAFRLNQIIGKHQLITEILECPPANKEAPFCSLRGTSPTP